MLLFTEAHLEYNAGLVISVGSLNRPSPVEATSTAESLAEELEDYRQQLLAMAAPPECPTEASQGGSLFTPLLGVSMEHLLICVTNFGRFQAVPQVPTVTRRICRQLTGQNVRTQVP